MKTACGKCKWHRTWMLGHICVVDESEVFDFLSGEMVKDTEAWASSDNAMLCKEKNTGDCPDFLEVII